MSLSKDFSGSSDGVNVFITEVKTAGGRLETGQNMLKAGT
jgi:hypothetical protein